MSIYLQYNILQRAHGVVTPAEPNLNARQTGLDYFRTFPFNVVLCK